MASYGKLPNNFNTMNESQQNDAVIAAGYSGLSDFRDNASNIAQGNTSGQNNAQISAPANALASVAPTFGSKDGIVRYTNAAQNTAFGSYSDPNAPGVNSISEITAGLKEMLPTEAPKAPNMLETYQTLTADGTVTALEKSIIDLKAERENAIAQLEVNKTAEMGKPVAENVVQGRISEQQRMAQEKVDFINRRLTTASDELTMRYKSIETIMKYTQIDFENAKSTYDTQFKQAMDIMTQARGIRQDQLSEQDKAQDNARANLQIYANAITSGNLNVNDLPPESQAALNGMELAAGLPMGFIQNLEMKPNEKIAHINDKTGQVYAFDGNGGLTVIGNVGANSSGKAAEKPTYASSDDIDVAREAFASVDTNKDKLLSLAEFEKAKRLVESRIANPDVAASALNTASNEYGRWKW